MTVLFINALLLGLLFNATPGAIFTESLRRGLRGGFRPALDVQLGSLAGDFIWALLGLAGAAALFSLPYVEKPLAIAGAILLGWMAWQALRDGLAPLPTFDPSGSAGRSAITTGAALSLANPQNITYWTGLGGTITALGVADPGWTAFTVFLAGFMLASLSWCFICAGAIASTRRFVGPRTWMILNIGCAIGLAYFAGLVLFRSLVGAGVFVRDPSRAGHMLSLEPTVELFRLIERRSVWEALGGLNAIFPLLLIPTEITPRERAIRFFCSCPRPARAAQYPAQSVSLPPSSPASRKCRRSK